MATKTEMQDERKVGRRQVLEKLASAVFAGLVAPAVLGEATAAETAAPPELPELPSPQPNEDPVLRMMRDLQRALKKPVEQRHWVMVIDLRKCGGCNACTIACAVENKLPPGVFYRPVMEQELGKYPHVGRRFIPRPCMQCNNPPCVPPCPVTDNPNSPNGKATWKRPDGIVFIDYEACIGCRRCIPACPYGARTLDEGRMHTQGTPSPSRSLVGRENETAVNYEYRKRWTRRSDEPPVRCARKCHFCLHRIERGLLPQCTVTCVGRATFFGDANDPESLVAELISKPNVMCLKEEAGTEPNVFYLI